MARLETRIDAPADEVWGVLHDGYSYEKWVVGTQEIRYVEPSWPQVGSSLHFTAGLGPIQHRDRTTVRAYDPAGRVLELEAHAWPLGTARIELRVRDDGAGSQVLLDEHPLRGPAGLTHNPVLDALLWLRGHLMLRRFRQLVTAR